MVKKLTLLALAAVTAQPAAAQQLTPATTSGGFSAVAHREITTGGTTKAMVYSVLGSLTLTRAGTRPVPLSAECLGFDEHGEGQPTIGIGRCVWKESSTDALFVSIRTEGDRNVYTVTGGTGRWAGARGEIRTSFTYLPAPDGIFLLHEAGSGQLGVANK